jgi:hypothetical protein
MRQLFTKTFFLAGQIWSSGTVAADTRAPSAQTFVLECGGETITVVSPSVPAAADCQSRGIVSLEGVIKAP